ncbi:protein FAR1-RELATED SEQUENCE 5-like [Bidens hawaiensis]|uniref:protein FAR1-RELATED SEQUENCE 5-like n=1 Tax=Bidens hawaiensis TaxID=980011 RepID=UPI00404B790C
MAFESIDLAYDFYCEYAKKAGFCVRKGGSYMNDGILKSKYFTCSKEGHKPLKSYDSMDNKESSKRPYYKRRKRPTIRCGRKAQIFLKSVDGIKFEINEFVEEHNHAMVEEEDMHFVRSNRKLTHVQEDILYELSTLNLGPVKAFNILRTKYRGFEEVRASKDDCKNFKQRLNCFIGEFDAEMVVQRLTGKKRSNEDFSFEYTVNDNGELTRLFWADEISKKNYLAFGDIIAFDATFKTNKYKMVFVPFTTIDNHCRNITVGAGLLSSESIESYTWLLKVFLNSFGVTPKVVVTDQDPAIKQAIASVFSNTRQRLCMWHIMKKLADKVGVALCNNEDFKRKICDIVWTDSISQFEFETKWQLIMKEFDLESNKWLTDIFYMRYDWIPAYYRDEPHFDHRMEIQRLNNRKNDHDTRYTHPELVSESPIEQEVELMYTRAIFNDFQDEMYHIRSGVASLKSTEEGDYLKFSIFDFNAYVPGCLEVLIKKDGEDGVDSIVSCSCKIFEQYGLLCRHILYVLNLFRVKRFSKKYILDRWKRDAGVNIRTAPISNLGNEKNLKVKEISREITLTGEYLINSYVTDIDELTKVRDQMNIMIQKVDETRYQRTSLSKRDRFAAVLGYDQPSEVTVRVPSGIRNKGRGSHNRIKSQKEIAIGRSGKKHRECKVCNLPGHNS